MDLEFIQQCLPHVDPLLLKELYEEEKQIKGTQFSLDQFVSDLVQQFAVEQISNNPPSTLDTNIIDLEEDEVPENKNSIPPSSASKQDTKITNNTLRELHQQRIVNTSTKQLQARQSSSSSSSPSVNRDLLAQIHSQRIHSNNPTTINPISPATSRSLPLKSTNLKDQLKQARMKQKEKWRQEGPTAKFMRISDLNSKDQLVTQSKAGDWNSSSSSKGGIHSLQSFADADRIGKEALEFTNVFRAKQGLAPLKWSQALADIGKVHSKNMGNGITPFGHDGFNQRVQSYPMASRSAAENVAMNNSGSVQVAEIAVNGWIDSPGHRKNLLANHNYCGIGVYQNSNGMFYLTQLFALTD